MIYIIYTVGVADLFLDVKGPPFRIMGIDVRNGGPRNGVKSPIYTHKTHTIYIAMMTDNRIRKWVRWLVKAMKFPD